MPWAMHKVLMYYYVGQEKGMQPNYDIFRIHLKLTFLSQKTTENTMLINAKIIG